MAAKRHESKYEASKTLKDAMELELAELDARIARLRVLYDQYFMGIERMEPTYLRSEVDKIFRRSQVLRRGSTVFKFRFRSLQRRYTAYRSYWDRVVRMIEDGQIRRGVNVMGGRTPAGEGVEDIPDEVGDRSGPQESLVSKRRRFRRREGDADPALANAAEVAADQLREKTSPGRTEFAPGEVQALYDCLMREKKRVGENTESLSASVVQRSVERILEKVPEGKRVNFRVVCDDGQVSVKAVVKKDKEG